MFELGTNNKFALYCVSIRRDKQWWDMFEYGTSWPVCVPECPVYR